MKKPRVIRGDSLSMPASRTRSFPSSVKTPGGDAPETDERDDGRARFGYWIVGRRLVRRRIDRRTIRWIPRFVVVRRSDHRLIGWEFAARPAVPVERLGWSGDSHQTGRGCKPAHSMTNSSHSIPPGAAFSSRKASKRRVIPHCRFHVNPGFAPRDSGGAKGSGSCLSRCRKLSIPESLRVPTAIWPKGEEQGVRKCDRGHGNEGEWA